MMNLSGNRVTESVILNNPGKAVHRSEREGKQSASLVIKVGDLVIAPGRDLTLIPLASFASLAVQLPEWG